MEVWMKRAEQLLIEVSKELQRLISDSGEDISYYNHTILNEPIKKLIDAKVMMGISKGIKG